MATMSTYFANWVIDHMLRGQAFTPPSTIYVSLHTADPGDAGANEVTGGGYARQAVTLAAAANKATSNTAVIEFTNMPAVTITHVGIWNAPTGGNLLMYGPLTTPKTVNAGDTVRFNVGDLDITFT